MKKKITPAVVLFVLLLIAVSPLAASAAEPDTPDLSGSVKAAMTLNLESGLTTYLLGEEKELAPGETTRMALAAVAYERLSERLNEQVTFTDEMVYSRGGLFIPGDVVDIGDLFEGLLLQGSGDSAKALAILSCGSVEEAEIEINKLASALGMKNTVYENIYGNQSIFSKTTVGDVMLLARHFRAFSYLTGTASASSAKVAMAGVQVDIFNRSAFASVYYNTKYRRTDLDSYMVGGGCLVCAGEKGGLTYITVIMGAPANSGSEPNVYTASGELMDYAYDNFGFRELLPEGRIFGELPVSLSAVSDGVTYANDRAVKVFCRSDADLDALTQLEIVMDTDSLTAPIERGRRVGSLKISFDGRQVEELGLYTTAALPKSTMMEFSATVGRLIRSPLVIAAIVLAGAALLAAPFVHAIRASANDEE